MALALGQAQAQDTPESGEAQPQQAAAEKKKVTFNVWEFRVKGNSLIERTLVERTVYPFLGPDRSIQDVEAARVALETLYKNNGYPTVLVNIPEQDVSDGVVKLEVVQGRVDRMRISGSTYFSLGKIRKAVPALAEGEVPNLPQVQKQLQALNQQSADRRITPIFRPGRTPGTVEVELRVKDELPLHGSVELNGRNSANTSRTRLTGNLRYDNLWQKMHSLSLQYQVSPQNLNEVAVLAATYVLPVGDSRDRLALYAIDSESESQVASTGALSVIGNGTILGARWVKPLGSTGGYSHTLTLGTDYKDFDEAIELVGADSLKTPINYTRFSTEYRGNWYKDRSVTSFSVGANFALRGMGNTEGEFENKRFQAQPNFVYLTGELSREMELENDMRFRGALQAQLAGQPLISNEQFSAGGAQSVRGYYESEELGDDGISGSVELYTPSFADKLHEDVDNLRLLVFADAAHLVIHQALPGSPDRYELYGAGAGLRLSAFNHLDVNFDMAWPLVKTSDVDKGDARAHFSLNYGF